jgi:hypothetical protein
MTTLDHALALGARGFKIFPVVPGGKLPAVKGWQAHATSDPAGIRALWTNPDFNIGVSTVDLLALDLDGAAGLRSVFDLDLQHGEPGWLDSLTVETWSGGRHIYLKPPHAVRNSAKKLAPGVDTRGDGGFVVGPGSIVNGRPYRIIRDLPIKPAPETLVQAIGRPTERATKPGTALCELDDAAALERSRKHLKTAERAELGARGSTAYRVAAQLKDFGISAGACLELMAEHWANSHCEPPIDFEELSDSVSHAYTYGKEPIGSRNPVVDFAPVATGADVVPIDKPTTHLYFELAEDVAPDLDRVSLIDGWLDHGTMGVLYGASNVGKTFVALDWSYSVAAGVPWAGCKVDQGALSMWRPKPAVPSGSASRH